MINRRRAYGTPSYEESNLLWKRRWWERQATASEYHTALESFKNHLAGQVRLMQGVAPGDAYVRGDFFGDRTHYLEICNPGILTEALLQHIQEWLRSYGHKNWRVFIPTYAGRDQEVIVIYPGCLRFSRHYEKASSRPHILETLSRAMAQKRSV
jgi:hypothetical protein